MSALRLFVGVEIDAQARDALAREVEDLRRACPDARFEAPEKYHVTLKFLGETPPARVPAVTEGLDRASWGFETFAARLEGFGSFPPGRDPRVVWSGVAEGAEAFSALAERVERELAPLGFPPEGRAFHAHATVARLRPEGRRADVRALREAIASRADRAIGAPFRVERVTLFESALGRGGSRYAVLHASALGRAEGRG